MSYVPVRLETPDSFKQELPWMELPNHWYITVTLLYFNYGGKRNAVPQAGCASTEKVDDLHPQSFSSKRDTQDIRQRERKKM